MPLQRKPGDDDDVAPRPEEKKAAQAKAESKAYSVINNGNYPLTDPVSNQRFAPGQVTEVHKRTGWLQAQLDAGIFKEV